MIRRTLRRLTAALVEQGRADHPPRAHRPRSLAPLPRRTPGAPLIPAARARYAAANSPYSADDRVYVAASGALIRVHHLTDEEIF